MTNATHGDFIGLDRDDAHHRLAAETEIAENYLAIQNRIDNSDPSLLQLQRDVQTSFVARFRQLATDLEAGPETDLGRARSNELPASSSTNSVDDWEERWNACIQANACNKGELVLLERLKSDNRAQYTARNRQLEEAWDAVVVDNHRLTAETWALRAERGI